MLTLTLGEQVQERGGAKVRSAAKEKKTEVQAAGAREVHFARYRADVQNQARSMGRQLTGLRAVLRRQNCNCCVLFARLAHCQAPQHLLGCGA